VRPKGAGPWVLFVTALLMVAAWPPEKGRSLLVTALNWAVDPGDSLPVLPEQLGFGAGDDVRAVEARDAEVRRYDEYLARGGFARLRLQLKVAEDPFNPVTERQLLLVAGVIVAFLVLRR
jgi:hypothetical protein